MVDTTPLTGADVTIAIAHIPERADLLARALASVETQTITGFETLIVVAEEGQSAAEVRNKALRCVVTPVVAWLDDDDVLLPVHLQVCLDAMNTSGADLVYPGAEFVGCTDPLAVAVAGDWVNPFGVSFGPEQEAHLRAEGNFIPVTYLARTQTVRAAGGFPEPFSAGWPYCCEDWGLLVRMLDAGAVFHHVPVRTWQYHVNGRNTGGTPTGRAGVKR